MNEPIKVYRAAKTGPETKIQGPSAYNTSSPSSPSLPYAPTPATRQHMLTFTPVKVLARSLMGSVFSILVWPRKAS